MMAIRQTRIYAPATAPYDNNLWAETMMGRIIKPLVDGNAKLEWFWFTRYFSMQPDFGDSDGANPPLGFFDNNRCRSLRLRFEIANKDVEEFEREGSELIGAEGCWFADWRDYGIGELCSSRFIGEDRSQARCDERLILVKRYLQSVCCLTLHALVSADDQGRFRFEHNDDSQNPHESPFFSLHHLFCNPTDVFLTVLVASDGSNLVCGTRQAPPASLSENASIPFVEFRVRF